MQRALKTVSITFCGGVFGAIVNSLLVWYLGEKGISKQLGVQLAPHLTLSFLYPRLIWGGFWGLMFALPLWRNGFWVGIFSRGILFSLAPSAFQLLYVFPHLHGKGMLGLALGNITPYFVCAVNAVWGLCAAAWAHAADDL